MSVDAFAFGALGYPDDAYRYARGEPVKHASGRHIRIKTALDFMAVTDHAEYLGVLNAMGDPASPLSKLQLARQLYSKEKSMLTSAAGLAGVWAEENTRESIFAALKRKEAFATSGPRIRIRMFAGWSFEDSILGRPDMIRTAYANGVAMGGNFHATGNGTKIPHLLISAMRDPDSAPLQRLQVIKGWLADGETHERVFDVVCSDGLEPVNYRCPDNGATVDLDDCRHSADRGDVELAGVWTDPDFDAAASAFYYARVLENPTCRWSTWDALRMGWDLPSEVPAVIQERAWTSPVWYEPGKK